jgi:hypothetical protein
MSAATWTGHGRAHDAGHDGFDALAQAFLVIGGVIVLVAGQRVGAGLVVAAGQQIAAVVDDGDAVGLEARDGGRHQMLDGGTWPRSSGPGLQHHRSARAAGRRAKRSGVRE